MSMLDATLLPNEEASVFRKKSLKESVFDLLHQRIVAGKYLPGDWLRQEEIAQQLGVSQTPVREALDLLVSTGLAERVPYRGVRVPEPPPEAIADAYALRLLLESAAARLAAHNISPDQARLLAEMVEQTRSLVTLDDMSLQRQLNKKIHLLIAEASGNSWLSKMHQMTSNLFPDWRLYEYMFRHPELLESALSREYEEHKSISEAISAGDGDLAARRSIRHIQNLREELITYLGIPAALIEAKEAPLRPLIR
jgi:DNA-binding GntR family transcriptional regulator